MAKPSGEHSPEEISDSIRRIRDFHALGVKSLKNRPGRAKYGDTEIEREATELGLNPSTYRAARRFADPVSGYSAEELKNLFKEFERHRHSLGVMHIVALLGLPKADQVELALQAIRNRWGVLTLRREIRKRFGPRRSGGRRRAVPRERTSLLGQIEAMCDSWRRWEAELNRPIGKDEESPASKLSKQVRQVIANIGRGIADLRVMAEKELAKESPKREKRHVADEVSVPRQARRPRR